MIYSNLSGFFKCEDCGAIPYLKSYLIPQFSCRIVKTSFGKFQVLIWHIDIMTVSCLLCRYLRSHGEFSIKTASTQDIQYLICHYSLG